MRTAFLSPRRIGPISSPAGDQVILLLRSKPRRQSPFIARCSSNSSSDDDTPPMPPFPSNKSPFFRPAPVISYQRSQFCRICNGTSLVPCSACYGTGILPVGGYQSKNPVNATRIIGSAWTAMETTMGWRHFQCRQKQKRSKDTYVLLVATCDESVQLWVNMKNLKDRSLWAAGWLQKKELLALRSAPSSGNAQHGTACKVCRGSGRVECGLCKRAGQVIDVN